MVYSDPTVDRIEASFKSLADDVNRTSASTRNGWVFFLALQAYFFIALAGITHRDLLLDTPIPLPLLQVPIRLQGFFLFGPVILVLVHMGILLQHVMLARQARELHGRIASFEGRGLFRNHSVRTHLHPYVFTQLLAGPQRSPFFAFFLLLLTWLSLGILPVFLLLNFQATFLPYHDLHVTWAQRGILVLDMLILAVFAVFMRYPALTFTAGFGRTILERPLSFLINLLLAGAAMFFSLSVATIPGERMDRAMTWLLPTDIVDAQKDRTQTRQAFWLTALLFEGAVDPLSGRPASIFGRNLIVTDADLVKDNAFDESETSISLRTPRPAIWHFRPHRPASGRPDRRQSHPGEPARGQSGGGESGKGDLPRRRPLARAGSADHQLRTPGHRHQPARRGSAGRQPCAGQSARRDPRRRDAGRRRFPRRANGPASCCRSKATGSEFLISKGSTDPTRWTFCRAP